MTRYADTAPATVPRSVERAQALCWKPILLLPDVSNKSSPRSSFAHWRRGAASLLELC